MEMAGVEEMEDMTGVEITTRVEVMTNIKSNVRKNM
jgi:hypothetical protein